MFINTYNNCKLKSGKSILIKKSAFESIQGILNNSVKRLKNQNPIYIALYLCSHIIEGLQA